ncbi:glycerophosphodiester phosphodiesterase family protein [Rhodobacter sp. 24-YEA-8]|uniref:glycerophosphodiester phosphodiesterase family protein n=1 Tax=Rhodobacter sp. 24-YEA-8 TaxID=1884310 RepID=UPI0008988062|nr:glycerophosphodiester phosphodiesterase family protein [Rhodobacter sp. 24-YEA-8]SEC58011.1 Glycerophosphoryl diester phosphodiesterase [Rhodobacter sp. 24-YEA-8]
MTRVPLPPSLLCLPVAHRALHDRSRGIIENSPAAIRAAISAGYAIEIDLQLSQDGVAMVFHDEDLDRLTHETGPLNARNAADLSRITLKDSEDRIPTFAEVLDLVAGQVPLLVEIKDQTLTMSATDGRLEAETARLLADYRGDVAVMSFNPHSIAHMARLAPGIARGITTSAYEAEDWAPLDPAICDHLREIPDFARTDASFISHEAADLPRPRVAALKAQGAAILCWTIRSPEAEAKAREIAQNVTFEGYSAPLPA